MPAHSRHDLFDPLVVSTNHCWSRCVRRARLCGYDPYSGKNYDHRKEWIYAGLKRLARQMAIEVLDFAVLDNHFHVVLRNRPDVVRAWSDEEVVRRWWALCPERRRKNGDPVELTPEKLAALVGDAAWVEERRIRLSDISWFMRLLTQPLARRANQEDEVTGRFFAERFGNQPLESLEQLLTCSMYVDLNLVRAGMALTPETSRYTSVYDRIRGRLRRRRDGVIYPEPAREGDEDDWLAPLFLDEQALRASDVQPAETVAAAAAGTPPAAGEEGEAAPAPSDRPWDLIPPTRLSNKGFLPLLLDEYLQLLDWTGRQLAPGKRGTIPAHLESILRRLQLDSDQWLDAVEMYVPRPRRPRHGCREEARQACTAGTLTCHHWADAPYARHSYRALLADGTCCRSAVFAIPLRPLPARPRSKPAP